MHRKLGMPHRKLMLPSFTAQDITELYQSIKQRHNCIIHSLQTEEIRVPRWLWVIVTGAGLEPGKVVNALLGGMELPLKKASQLCLCKDNCLMLQVSYGKISVW